MKNVRLNVSQLHRWRLNRFALIAEDTGEFVRFATLNESIQATEAVRRRRQIKVKENGRLLHFRLDRERLKEELRRDHGQNVRALARNNQQLFTARSFQPTIDPQQKPQAPNPNRCKCSEWEGRPDGRHHPHCSFNAIAPEEHRSDLGDLVIEGGGALTDVSELEPEPLDAIAAVATGCASAVSDVGMVEPRSMLAAAPAVITPEAVVEVRDPPLAPSDCECLKWRRPEGHDTDQHHPSCDKDAEWRSYVDGELPSFVFTLNGTLMRRASPEEKKEADARLRSQGSPTIRIGSEEFLVLAEAP